MLLVLRVVLGCRIAAGVPERLRVSEPDLGVEGGADIETTTSRHVFEDSSYFVWRLECVVGLWCSQRACVDLVVPEGTTSVFVECCIVGWQI
jgi:hypothetical protein